MTGLLLWAGWSTRREGEESVLSRARGNHALGQLVLPVGQLVVLPLVFPLVGEELAAGVEDVVAVAPDAVDVIVGPGELAAEEPTGLVLHELLESVLVELLVLHVVVLVFLCQ